MPISSRLFRRAAAPSRRRFLSWMAATPLLGKALLAQDPAGPQAVITKFGAVADGVTLNTKAIQAAIDQLAARSGGTVVIPRGVFISGALFFKPGVNLRLEEGAVLRCSTDMANFPAQRTRVEGHFEDHFNPALINVRHCDGFQITGTGTLDGAGRPIWDQFWKERNASPDPHNFRNLAVPRARLAFIESSHKVRVEGITFKDSQFWNLHIYKCDDVLVQQVRFEVPDDYKQAPSTDGIDLDSSRNVTVDGCFFSVTDDCIAAKGSKGPNALDDADSPPVEHIRVRNCTYKRGNGVLTLGSEATVVRDIVVENCKVIGNVKVAVLKLRSDTPQHYEDIHFRNITLDAASAPILTIQPWSQYTNLQGQKPPQSIVRNISLTGISGRAGALGIIHPNPGQTAISDILLKDFDVQLQHPELAASGVTDLKLEHVLINGREYTPRPQNG